MQCKDIPDRPVLRFLASIERGEVTVSWEERQCAPGYGGPIPAGSYVARSAIWFAKEDGSPLSQNSVQHAMPPGVAPKLALAKMRMLMRRGWVDGCPCGCRGDFELTDRGRAEAGRP
jgi:hypothetical protein